MVRHAMTGEEGNEIVNHGDGSTGNERSHISSYNRIRDYFTVLFYASDATGESSATISIPAKIMSGQHDNRGVSHRDVRGEGFANGDTYFALITKEISPEEGCDVETV